MRLVRAARCRRRILQGRRPPAGIGSCAGCGCYFPGQVTGPRCTCTYSAIRSDTAVAVDPSTDTVYVTNQYGNTVSVVDGATSTVTATIGVGLQPTGMGIDPATGSVYIANHGDDSVSVIDEASSTVTATTAYLSAGDLDRAIPLFEQVLTDRLRVPGTDNPGTSTL